MTAPFAEIEAEEEAPARRPFPSEFIAAMLMLAILLVAGAAFLILTETGHDLLAQFRWIEGAS